MRVRVNIRLILDIGCTKGQGGMRENMKKEWVLNVILRSILGIIAMYFINGALERAGVSLGVGINGATVLTSGILGIPGLAALYGIELYKIL